MFEAPPELTVANPHVACSRELELVIFKCLAKDPNERYATMDELCEALLDAKFGKISEPTLAGYGEPVKAVARPPRAPRDEPSLTSITPPSGSRASMVVGSLVLLAMGAGGAYLLTKSDTTDGTTTAVEAGPAGVDAGEGDAPAEEADAAADSTADTADAGEEDAGTEAPATVTLTVETSIPGARLVVEGHDDLGCDATPCTLEVPAGQTFNLMAQRGRSRGRESITPSEDASVSIVLRPRRIRGTGTMMQGNGNGPSANDLKMIDAFER